MTDQPAVYTEALIRTLKALARKDKRWEEYLSWFEDEEEGPFSAAYVFDDFITFNVFDDVYETSVKLNKLFMENLRELVDDDNFAEVQSYLDALVKQAKERIERDALEPFIHFMRSRWDR
jgi:hypothetical protein